MTYHVVYYEVLDHTRALRVCSDDLHQLLSVYGETKIVFRGSAQQCIRYADCRGRVHTDTPRLKQIFRRKRCEAS